MSEAAEIKRDGMVPVKNSGRSRSTKKGDAVLGQFLVDIKEYPESFAVSRSNWKKISGDAVVNGRRLPAFKLVLGKDLPIRLWVIEDKVFHEMREAWEEKYAS